MVVSKKDKKGGKPPEKKGKQSTKKSKEKVTLPSKVCLKETQKGNFENPPEMSKEDRNIRIVEAFIDHPRDLKGAINWLIEQGVVDITPRIYYKTLKNEQARAYEKLVTIGLQYEPILARMLEKLEHDENSLREEIIKDDPNAIKVNGRFQLARFQMIKSLFYTQIKRRMEIKVKENELPSQ